MTIYRAGISAALLLYCGLPAAAQGPIPAATPFLSQAQVREDPRLEQRVTVWERSVYLGELLERLTAETGIELLAGDGTDGAADFQLTVFMEERPLAELLNAVWSLVSYRNAEWQWRRSGAPGAYRYRLVRPPAARELAARVREDAESMEEAVLEARIAALRLPPAELARAAERDPATYELLVTDPRFRAGMEILGAALDSDQRQGALDGERIWVPLGQLSESSRGFILAEWERRHRTPPGDPSPPPPTGVTFQRLGPLTSLRFGLELWIHRRDGDGSSDASVGTGVLHGGNIAFDAAMRARIRAGWLLFGDQQGHAAETRGLPVEAPPVASAATAAAGPGTSVASKNLLHLTRLRLEQLAKGGSVPVLAGLPQNMSARSDAPEGKTLREFLEHLTTRPRSHYYKWRGDCLLITHLSWLMEENEVAPWEVVKHLRAAEAASPDGFLPLEVLVPAAQLDRQQIESLLTEFAFLVELPAQVDLVRFYGSSPELAARLRSPDGVPVEELRELPRETGVGALDNLVHRVGAVSVAARVEDREEGGVPVRRLTFLARDAAGEELGRLSFAYSKRPPPAPNL